MAVGVGDGVDVGVCVAPGVGVVVPLVPVAVTVVVAVAVPVASLAAVAVALAVGDAISRFSASSLSSVPGGDTEGRPLNVLTTGISRTTSDTVPFSSGRIGVKLARA
jgi:hypothetical protein